MAHGKLKGKSTGLKLSGISASNGMTEQNQETGSSTTIRGKHLHDLS
jgi:hypothetical protein